MSVVKETVVINGNDVEVYKIAGHPDEDSTIFANKLSDIDVARLLLATGGTIKGRDVASIGETELTGDFLNLYQAKFTDINRWAYDYFGDLIVDLPVATTALIKTEIGVDVIDAIYKLSNRVATLEDAANT